MQKIIPIHIAQRGGDTVNKIVGINTNRIHNDVRVQKIEDQTYTKLTYYLDPDKKATETLFVTDPPAAIYKEMDKPFDVLRVVLPLVGGGTVSILTTNIIYCYMNVNTYERCSIDAFVGNRRNLYILNMTFMELLTAINSLQETYYDDLQSSVSNVRLPSSNAPTWRDYNHGISGGVTFPVLGFAVGNIVYLDIQTYHSMKLNTVLDQHIHYITPTDGTDDRFNFQLDVIAAGLNANWTAPTGSPYTAEHLITGNYSNSHKLLQVQG
jgi:hypothetical protein